MSYSLDDVLPPRKAQNIDGSVAAWLIVGHSAWIAALVVLVLRGAGAGESALAVAQLAALVLVVVAWNRRFTSDVAARVVAWASTPLLGFSLIRLLIAIPAGIAFLVGDYNFLEFTAAQDLRVSAFVLHVLLVVPTVGACLASLRHVLALRDAQAQLSPSGGTVAATRADM